MEVVQGLRPARTLAAGVQTVVPASPPPSRDVTELLHAWSDGDQGAFDQLMPLVYGELHERAERYMRNQPPGHTLSATALVHEAYLRLADPGRSDMRSRAHFFGVASKAMRSVLVDHARGRQRDKRGGGANPITLAAADEVAGASPDADVLALDEALTRLAGLDADKSRLVELRYFAGLTIDETAEVLGVSSATVKREWVAARAWLSRELAAA
jgi:RNA polymerase sigma factor (TIGR02999 family)